MGVRIRTIVRVRRGRVRDKVMVMVLPEDQPRVMARVIITVRMIRVSNNLGLRLEGLGLGLRLRGLGFLQGVAGYGYRAVGRGLG